MAKLVANDIHVTGRMPRSFLERLCEGADLARDPVTRLLAPLPAFGGGPEPSREDQARSAAVACGLRALWRRHFMPPVLSLERRTPWNYYFLLEVLYFYPYAHARRYPETLKDAAVLLCDEAHLALIVADGEQAEAQRLLQANRAFWKGIVPETMIPAGQTLHSRRDAALGKLALEVYRQLAAAERAGRQASALTHEAERSAAVAVSVSKPDAPSALETLLPPIALPHGATEKIQRDGEPLSPNARRLLEACQTSVVSPVRVNFAVAPRPPQPYPQEFLHRLAEQVAPIRPAQLDDLALWLDALGFPAMFGVKRSYRNNGWWWDDDHLQRALTERFCHSDEPVIQLQCAAALRQSSLTAPIRHGTRWLGIGEPEWVSALQEIAELTMQSVLGSQRRGIAPAVLARPEHARRLSGLGERYHPLLYELANPQSVVAGFARPDIIGEVEGTIR